MILVTGGAGFIGSNLHAAIVARGAETAVVDWLGGAGKWSNLAGHPPTHLISPDDLDAFLASEPPVEMVFHLGAVSDTTATDGDLVWRTNVDLPTTLWRWCARWQVRFVYASSAATYGDGRFGFDDGLEGIQRLRPLNLYGWSKHAFDLSVLRLVAQGAPRPPQWVGLKFFNVYGPNEQHKAHMRSVIRVKIEEVRAGKAPRLFRSDRPDIRDGEQKRDFVWVGDVVDVLLWLMDSPAVNGLFNVGTGVARSYLDVARAVCSALDAPQKIEFIDMPDRLRGQYQHFTEAPITRLRGAGFLRAFTSLEEGVSRYVSCAEH